jgi:hypothetical protein
MIEARQGEASRHNQKHTSNLCDEGALGGSGGCAHAGTLHDIGEHHPNSYLVEIFTKLVQFYM